MRLDWNKIKVVIFDVDGTLYNQSGLRKKMLLSLMKYYAIRPWKLKEMVVLHHFRAQREKMAHSQYTNLEDAQYEWCSQKVTYPIESIKKVVDHWIFTYPINYLKHCTYPGVSTLFDTLKKYNIGVAIYSDYKADTKLKAMGLEADLVVASTDSHIDRLKPDPRGLEYIAKQFHVQVEECLFIGDRYELDATCAINAKMPYLLVDKKPYKEFDFYDKITSEINLHFTKN